MLVLVAYLGHNEKVLHSNERKGPIKLGWATVIEAVFAPAVKLATLPSTGGSFPLCATMTPPTIFTTGLRVR